MSLIGAISDIKKKSSTLYFQEWQAQTERRVLAEQERERRKDRMMASALLENNNDTEDDTVSSMEYDDHHHPDPADIPMTEDQVNLLYLRTSGHLQNTAPDTEDPPRSPGRSVTKPQPRPFLKRGAGLARFNLPTDLEKQPNRVKKKQPKVKNIASKYTEVRSKIVT